MDGVSGPTALFHISSSFARRHVKSIIPGVGNILIRNRTFHNVRCYWRTTINTVAELLDPTTFEYETDRNRTVGWVPGYPNEEVELVSPSELGIIDRLLRFCRGSTSSNLLKPALSFVCGNGAPKSEDEVL